MASWFTCVKRKIAGLILCLSKRHDNISPINVHLTETLRANERLNRFSAKINDSNRCELNKQPCRSELHAMATNEASMSDSGLQKEESCASDITVTTNCCNNKRKNDETQDDRKKRKKSSKQRPGERYVPPPQKRNQGVSFSEEHFAETSYYFENGLRKVYPYYYDFKTYCKGRWIGKTLLEVFHSEFRSESMDYYNKAVKSARIRLNETPVDNLNVTLKNNDFLRNTVHRHEPPVSGRDLEVLVDDGDVVVVDKPSSLPVHPCGRYRHNTVIFILGKEKGLSGLHTVHRLDRLTSGVLLFARTLEVSKKLDAMVRERQLEKEYVCRVDGEFPDGEVVCEEPILVVSFKVGLCRVDPKGKECCTVFQKLSFNGRSSVVRCLPLTGRTHQIRVHLQFLGFPIVNDPIYGSSAWGPNRAKGGLVDMSNDEILEALIKEHRSKESLHLLDLPDDDEISGKHGPTTSSEGDVKHTSQIKNEFDAWVLERSNEALATKRNIEILEAMIKERRSMQSLDLLDLPNDEVSGKHGPTTSSEGVVERKPSAWDLKSANEVLQRNTEILEAMLKEHRSKESLIPDDEISGKHGPKTNSEGDVKHTSESSAWVLNSSKEALAGKSNIEILKALIEENRLRLNLPIDEISGKHGPKTSSDRDVEHNSQMKSESSACDGSSCVVKLGEEQCMSRPACDTETKENSDKLDKTTKTKAFVRDDLCGECKIVRPDPTEKDLVMYLHALRYKGPDFEYSTRLPDWAKEDWVED